MNNLQACTQAGNLPAVRTIPEIEADILAQKRTIGASIVFIGRALIEAKGQLSHGQWGEWLKNRVNFSQSTAENYMHIAREFGEGSALLNLPYSKVLALLSVPKDEREDFARENDLEDKSVSQIKQLIRERDEARKHAAAAEAEIEKAHRYLDKANANAEKLIDAKQAAEARIRELEARKPETQIVEKETIPDDYEAVKTALADAKEIIDMVEQERDDALEALEAERENGSTAADPLDVIPFCDACAALLNRLYAAPYAESLLRTKTDVELERYAMNVQNVMAWAVKVSDVIENIRNERGGIEYDFCIA